jgi:hypothetical protein
VGCFEGYVLPKASQQPGKPEEIPPDGKISLEMVQAAITEWLERLKASVERAAILSDIIINENLKLANKLFGSKSGCFNLPSRSHCICNRTYGKTRYLMGALNVEVRTSCEKSLLTTRKHGANHQDNLIFCL